MSDKLHRAILDTENDCYELADLTNLACLLVECREIVGSSQEGTSSVARLMCLIDDRARALVKQWKLLHELAVKGKNDDARDP